MNKNEFINKLRGIDYKKFLKQYFFISLGVLLMDLGYYFFFDTTGIVAGGVTGLAIILKPLWANSTWFTSSTFLFGAEAICLLLGLIFLGKDFFLKTFYAALLSPFIIFIFEKTNLNPNIVVDCLADSNYKLIILVFCGACLTGVGVGIALRHNGSTGGMDVIQKMISKFAKIPISQTLIFTDWVIVIFSGYSFAENRYLLEHVIFGIGSLIAEGYIIDVIALSMKPRRTVYVISDRPQEIKDLIYKELDRGVTFSPVMGAYTNQERTMVICTMDKNEAYRIVGQISELDPKAFTFVTSCKEVRGEYDRKGLF